MLFDNPHARRAPYDQDLAATLCVAVAQARRAELGHWPLFRPGRTPLWPLPGLARHLGLARIDIKDESSRSPLGSAAVLAWPMALAQQLMRHHPDAGWTAATLLAGQHARALKRLGVVTARPGPRGLALAAAARSLGCRCRVVLTAQASPEDVAAWSDWGADILREADADAAAQAVQHLAQTPGWVCLDEADHGPRADAALALDLALGYSSLMDEVLTVRPPPTHGEGLRSPYTHVIVQSEGGADDAWVAGVLSPLWERLGAQRPRLILALPIWAGLPAWAQDALSDGADAAWGTQVLRPCVDHLVGVSVERSLAAMRLLAHSPWGDIPVVSAEAGGQGLGALLELMADPAPAAHLGLNADASVLLLSTEGAIRPGHYATQVGRRAESVRLDQARWQIGLLGVTAGISSSK